MPEYVPVVALPADLGSLIDESVREGFEFLIRLREEWRTGVHRFEEPGEVFFVARDAGSLAGVCGLNRDPYAGDPTVGRVRHLYVARRHRRRGLGRALVEHVLVLARERFESVRLRTTTEEADRFYCALGFRRLDGASDATHALSWGDAARVTPPS